MIIAKQYKEKEIRPEFLPKKLYTPTNWMKMIDLLNLKKSLATQTGKKQYVNF